MKKSVKLAAVFLSLAISCQFFTNAAVSTSKPELTEMDGPIEITSLRTEKTKSFEKEDGGFIATMYNEPVHFISEEGVWEEIDNSLIPVSHLHEEWNAVNSSSYYENKCNSFKVKLPQVLDADLPIVVQIKGFTLAFNMQNITPSCANISPMQSEAQRKSILEKKLALTRDKAAKEKILQDAAMAVPNQESAVSYPDVLPDTKADYQISGQTLKENLIFDSKPDRQDYTYYISCKGLTPVLQEFGAVYFYNTDDRDEEPIFIINAPYMFDSGDSLTMDVKVTLEIAEDSCLYTLTPSAEWLSDPQTVYPVTLDPTVTTSTSALDIEDNGVNQYNPKDNYMKVDRMYVGSNYDGKGYESRVYIRFPRVSSIPTTAYISNAVMYLDHHTSATYQTAVNNTFDVYEVGNYAWETDKITWNSQANYKFTNRVAYGRSDKSLSTEAYNITSLVQKWYSVTSKNNGVVIKPREVDNTKTNRTCYFSSDCSSTYASRRPRIQIEYYTTVPSVSTVADGTSYFLRNVKSGRYMDVYNGTDANLQNVHGYGFNGTAAQRWRARVNSDGTYSFISNVGSFSRYMDVTNGNLDIYSNFPTAQKFSLVRFNGTNMYYIKFGSQFVSENSDHNVITTDTNMGAASLWTFEYVYGLLTPLYSQMQNNPVPAKYQKSRYTSMTPNDALNLMRTSKVFIENSHGGIDGIDTGNGLMSRNMVLGLPDSDLRGVKLAVYVACETGKGGATAANLVNATFDKGAKAVIGFQENMGAIADTWSDTLMQSLSSGKTINQAMLDGDDAGYNTWGSYENIKIRTVRGDVSVDILN